MELFGNQPRAVFSDCGIYRYALWREWMPHPRTRCLFIMLNPSTADSEKLDPTVTRCVDFAKRWGFDALDVANVYALRSTDPHGLLEVADPVGPLNDFWISRLILRSSRIVVAWGNHCKPERAARVVELLGSRKAGCFKITKTGAPEHPLYQPARRKLIPYALRV
jgi:hypothetical protein